MVRLEVWHLLMRGGCAADIYIKYIHFLMGILFRAALHITQLLAYMLEENFPK